MVGKTINAILAGNSTLCTLIGQTSSVKKIFPYVMIEGTDLPGIVYSIDSVVPEYNKSGWSFDKVTFSVYSAAKNYADLHDIVSAIRDALELNKTGSGNEDINKIYLTGFEETYDQGSDVFANRLKFDVIVNSY